MTFPSELLYTHDHEWVRLEGDVATVGITDFAQGELGDIVFIEVNAIGKKLNAQDIFGTIEAVKTVSDLFMPIAGEVLEVNPELQNNPEVVNKDPYGEGWMVRLRCGANPDTSHLLKVDAYEATLTH